MSGHEYCILYAHIGKNASNYHQRVNIIAWIIKKNRMTAKEPSFFINFVDKYNGWMP